MLIILGLTVSTTTTLVEKFNTNIVDVNNDFHNLELSTNNIAGKNFKEIDVKYKDENQRNIISRYPSKVGKPSDFNDVYEEFKEISANDRNIWWGQNQNMVAEFDISKMGYSSKSEFLQDYNEVEISYNYGYNYTDNGHSNWQKGSAGVGIGTPESGSKIIGLKNHEIEVIVVDEEYAHTSTSRHRVKMTLKGIWASSTRYEIKFRSLALLDYNHKTKYAHAAYSGYKFKNVVVRG